MKNMYKIIYTKYKKKFKKILEKKILYKLDNNYLTK